MTSGRCGRGGPGEQGLYCLTRLPSHGREILHIAPDDPGTDESIKGPVNGRPRSLGQATGGLPGHEVTAGAILEVTGGEDYCVGTQFTEAPHERGRRQTGEEFGLGAVLETGDLLAQSRLEIPIR